MFWEWFEKSKVLKTVHVSVDHSKLLGDGSEEEKREDMENTESKEYGRSKTKASWEWDTSEMASLERKASLRDGEM